MGGINGYGISSYTEHRDWALKFVEFATGVEMVSKRQEMLGIVPARADALTDSSDTATKVTFSNLNDGTLVVYAVHNRRFALFGLLLKRVTKRLRRTAAANGRLLWTGCKRN